jgi:hypothetical protein
MCDRLLSRWGRKRRSLTIHDAEPESPLELAHDEDIGWVWGSDRVLGDRACYGLGSGGGFVRFVTGGIGDRLGGGRGFLWRGSDRLSNEIG